MARGRMIAVLALLACLAGCSRTGTADAGFSLSFEDRPEPRAFVHEGPAVRDAGDAAGLWAAVPGLPRPERAVVEGPGGEVVVALFRAGAGPVRLSAEAAEALGIGPEPARVRITALRREARLDTTSGRF